MAGSKHLRSPVVGALRWVGVGLMCGLASACGGDIGSKRAGEPCTRSDQCVEGLECADGVCRDPGDSGTAAE